MFVYVQFNCISNFPTANAVGLLFDIVLCAMKLRKHINEEVGVEEFSLHSMPRRKGKYYYIFVRSFDMLTD